jgi:hypothetical protein
MRLSTPPIVWLKRPLHLLFSRLVVKQERLQNLGWTVKDAGRAAEIPQVQIPTALAQGLQMQKSP